MNLERIELTTKVKYIRNHRQGIPPANQGRPAMTSQTTYTVYSFASGTEYGRGLLAADAAAVKLQHDGRDFAIRPIYKSGRFSRAEFSSLEDAEAFRAAQVADCDDEDREAVRVEYEPKLIGYRLWSRQEVANIKWHSTLVFSLAATQAEAEAEIFDEVIAADWGSYPTVVTDAEYDAMLAEIARREA